MSLLLPKTSISSTPDTTSTIQLAASPVRTSTELPSQLTTEVAIGSTSSSLPIVVAPNIDVRLKSNIAGGHIVRHACGLCGKMLYQFYLNPKEAIAMCSDAQCPYPFSLPESDFLNHITAAFAPLDSLWSHGED